MKKISSLIAIVFVIAGIASLSSCRKIIGEGPVLTEERTVANFTEVETSIPGAVYLAEGTVQQVRIESQQNIIDVVETKVEDGVLKLKLRNNTILANNSNLKVYISIPKFRAISLMGSGNVSAESGLNSYELDLKLTGSGNIDIDRLYGSNLYSQLTGSGNIRIGAGTVGYQTVRITGSGDYDAKNMNSNYADVTITGSGNATVKANNSLKARISGSGNVYYYGNPVTDVSITGSGNVKHQN
jgi:hypothetical protein